MGVPFIPKDFLSYIALIRQGAEEGTWIWSNPFTTDPQTPHMIMFFFTMLGMLCRFTGLDPVWSLELSRIPLLFIFFACFWYLLAPLLSDYRDRCMAAVLVAFSGGLEYFAGGLSDFLPARVSAQIKLDTWQMYGWNTFSGFYNPLWIAAMIPALFVLKAVLWSPPPESAKSFISAGIFFFITYLIHPYTALYLVAVIVAVPVTKMLLGETIDFKKQKNIFLGFVPAGLALLAIVIWQSQDALCRQSAANVFSSQILSVFWYPLTYGLLGIMAIRGACRWSKEAHPFRFSMFAWIAAAIMLHSSPLTSGYRFVFFLHLPVCIIAAGATRELFTHLYCVKKSFISTFLVAIILFSVPVAATYDSVLDAEKLNIVHNDIMQTMATLAELPAGNVVSPPSIGNMLPAFTSHRVWLGHWFLTPDYMARERTYNLIVSDVKNSGLLAEIVEAHKISYIVVPAAASPTVEKALAGRIARKLKHGNLATFVLAASSAQ
ncbi:MAG: hypothetical protein CVV42_19620 [Candidatus Riflebacteria bacterium HGW-Riflebacteria-2]|nr:MAG: hypothetical protein CVV42_19620 [Candidatus Riflebacteria bacterium HGW-Riflebacteria-2]